MDYRLCALRRGNSTVLVLFSPMPLLGTISSTARVRPRGALRHCEQKPGRVELWLNEACSKPNLCQGPPRELTTSSSLD